MLLHLDHISVKFEYQGHGIKVKVIQEKKIIFSYFNLLILCMWLQVINKVKVTHQGEGHIKVKVKLSSSLLTIRKILLRSTLTY